MSQSAKSVVAIVVLVLAQNCRPAERAVSAQPSQPGLQSISLRQVLANPRAYDGSRVRVVGFCHFEFEGDALYIQGADYFQQDTKHAIWLDVEHDPRILVLSNDYVIVEGRFEADSLGMFAGSLRDITALVATSPP